jgi:hypothetical protein
MSNGPKPDEPQPPTPEPEPTPAAKPAGVDPAAIQKAVSEGLSAALSARDQAVMRQQAQHHARQEAQTRQADPVRKVVLDAVGDVLGDASFRADAAADLAQFYTIHPEARAMAPEIESKFRDLAAEGRPMDRESIYFWYRGSPGTFEKLVAQEKERSAREEQEARYAQSVGPGIGRPVRVMKDPYEMTSDELSQALDGVSF